jgi:hypothetical protein
VSRRTIVEKMGPFVGPIVISGLISACGSSAAPIPPPDAAATIEVADAAADAAEVDAAWPWAGHEDALDQAADLAVDHVVPTPYSRPGYTRLAETGFFSDPDAGTLAPALVSFAPTHVLWSDGAQKRRWIALPPGAQIETRDMDHWEFPIGTRFFKEFSLGGKKLETRLVERYGPGPDDYWMGAFVWNPEQTDAVFVEKGQTDLLGTPHDAPAQKQCWSCHLGEPGRGLGFSALQLAGTGEGIRLEALARADLLTVPPARTDFHPPGDTLVAATLGYLHANCGHCHNRNGTSWPDTQMDLRLTYDDITPQATGLYRTTPAQGVTAYRNPDYATRVVPHDPGKSALMFRMQSRGSKDQMPPLATEMVDPVGLDLVKRWIESLP